jgi:predicted permease
MLQDVRYACRIIRKSPGFAAIVIFTLALGIGANTAVFSVVRGVLLQPPPYKDPARLVDIFEASLHNPSIDRGGTPYSDFEEYRRHARSFENIAFVTLWSPWNLLTGRGPARPAASVVVNEDFFATLGVSAARGRTFERGDLLRGCSVVLNDGFWRSTLGGDPAIVGKSLELNHHACTVLGIMPAGFDFSPPRTPLWVLFTPDDPRPRDHLLGHCIARLKPGVSVERAQSELAVLRREVRQADAYRDYKPVVFRLQDQFLFQAGKNLRATLGLLAAAVALVLLIACLNVANLLLARSSARTREFAVRAALGSGRARLVRQLLVEGLLLAGIGGAAGVMVAVGMVKYFLHANPIQLPIGSDVSVNLPVLLFTALLTMATALVFGIAPAWSGSRTGVSTALHAAGRGSISSGNHRLTRVLITAEISLSLMLLSGASLLMRKRVEDGHSAFGLRPRTLSIHLRPFARALLRERRRTRIL